MSAQLGPQTDFLRSPADICIYGGAAGGGKTVGLILEPLRYVGRVANFTVVFFRRTTPQITNPGGLWDEMNCIAPGVIATGRIMAMVIPGRIQSNLDRAELVALRRLGTVEDWARVVEFLATDLSDYLTGAVIPIHGGLVRG
jgi:hypothetical protein